MENSGVTGGSLNSDLNISLADIKPDLGTIPLWSQVKEMESDDVASTSFLGRSFRIRNPAEVLKLRRTLENIKLEKETPNIKKNDTGYAALHAKIDNVAKTLEEFRKQWLQFTANGAQRQSPMESLPKLQTSNNEESVMTTTEETSSEEFINSTLGRPPSPGEGETWAYVGITADEILNGNNGDMDGEQVASHSSINMPTSVSVDNQLRSLAVPNNIDITVLPGKPPCYRCNICQKRFTVKEQIIDHDGCKRGDSLFKCQKCGRGFLTKSHYDYHIKMHERELNGFKGTRERPGTYKGPRFFLPQRFL